MPVKEKARKRDSREKGEKERVFLRWDLDLEKNGTRYEYEARNAKKNGSNSCSDFAERKLARDSDESEGTFTLH